MVFQNEDVEAVSVEIPEGHAHLRMTFVLRDGQELVFQEATIANVVRAYVTIKTHPTIRKMFLKGGKIAKRKRGFAEWQLVESAQS